MDKIEIKNLLLRGIIGVNDWERVKKQDILINLEIYADLSKAGRSDKISDTINYRTVTKQIIEHVENSNHYLVEKLAENIAKIALNQPNVVKVKVKVEKPGALRFAESVGVELTRHK